MTRNMVFNSVCLGFVLGILWKSFLPFDFYAAAFLGTISLVIGLFFIFSRSDLEKIGKWMKLISFFIFAFSLGIIRFEIIDKPAPVVFENQTGSSVTLSGLIKDMPIVKDSGTEIVVGTERQGTNTNILLISKGDQEYKYGDNISFTGKLEKPANFSTDQGATFDYINYLKKDGIFYVVRNPKITVISTGGGNFLKRWLFLVRGRLVANLDSSISEPESGFMRGLILGDRASFSADEKIALTSTGLVYLVTIAGYHVSLVSNMILKLFGFLPAVFGGIIAMLGVLSYILMTGAAQTSIRAGIMALLVLIARLTGRTYDAGRALICAGVIMIFLNPFILAFDVSFELSFLATIAVLFFTPRVEEKLQVIKWTWLRESAALTIAVYIFILPFIIWKMGTWSLVTIPANLLVLPFIPFTMIFGFATGFAGIISNIVAFVPGKISYVLLRYELGIINLFSRLPFASLTIPQFPFVLVILIYGLFFYYLFRQSKNKIPFLIPLVAFLLTISAAGLISFRHSESNKAAKENMQSLLASSSAAAPLPPILTRIKTASCEIKGPLPNSDCSPGAIFPNATVEEICVKGYTKSVRNVSPKLRKQVFAEYDLPYPPAKGAYEVDHIVPLALGGSNDIANLFPEAAAPVPGFHEKDLVEIYLQGQVCDGRVDLSIAAHQIASDWLAVYNNLTPEEISALKKKYGGH